MVEKYIVNVPKQLKQSEIALKSRLRLRLTNRRYGLMTKSMVCELDFLTAKQVMLELLAER